MKYNKKIALLWRIDILSVVFLLGSSLFVDGNGRYPGLSESASCVILISNVILGLATDGIVGWLDRSRRAAAIAIALIYFLMFIPMLM